MVGRLSHVMTAVLIRFLLPSHSILEGASSPPFMYATAVQSFLDIW